MKYLVEKDIIPITNKNEFLMAIDTFNSSIVDNFTESDAQKVKDLEKVTNHDVKAVEY